MNAIAPLCARVKHKCGLVTVVKYFFLSDGWCVGRVWEVGGLWNEIAWRRKPRIEQLDLSVWENGEKLWLYRVEDEVLMVEVKPSPSVESGAIGQVVLKRLITADQAIDILCNVNKDIANL
ncbi:hypothetical protein LEP3755_29630 [Leptolyngbya sp. NIES-3755]|nr:hypothetical protein LEP3755_29630 [Leptolyngbya sp. NIES-3755]